MKLSKKQLIIISIVLIFIILSAITLLILNKISNTQNNQENSKEFIKLGSLGSFQPDLINNNNIEDIKFYTEAICNETNFCQDYEITCLKNEIINIYPIENATIQHSQDWQDPRGDNSLEDICKG